MKTLTTTTSLWLLMVLMFGFLCEDLHAAVVQAKQGKPKNATISSKETTSSTPKPKHGSKVKATTTTTSTTAKPKQDPTTVKPLDMDLDGRSAYINNHYVDDQEEPIVDTSQPLYELIQKQMESVLSNTGLTSGLYADSPQRKEVIGGNQNTPGKPLFSYNINQFDEYDEEAENENEEDVMEQEDQQPDNCEDTEESLSDNDDNSQYASPQTNQQNNYGQTISQQQQNPAQNSYNQNKPSSTSNKRPGEGGSYDTSNYNSPSSNNQDTGYGQVGKPSSPSSSNYNSPSSNNQDTGYGQVGKPSSPSSSNYNSPSSNNQDTGYGQVGKPSSASSSNHYHHHNQKPATQPQSAAYGQTTASQQNNKPSHSQTEKPKPQYPNNKPSQPASTNVQSSHNNQHKPHSSSSHKPSKLPASSPSSHLITKPQDTHKPSQSPPKPNQPIASGNSNAITSSPFSTSTTTNNISKPWGNKRHLTFRTVSSSTQYVSTPIADLMLKFSIGMAKPSKSSHDNQESQIYDKNDIE